MVKEMRTCFICGEEKDDNGFYMEEKDMCMTCEDKLGEDDYYDERSDGWEIIRVDSDELDKGMAEWLAGLKKRSKKRRKV